MKTTALTLPLCTSCWCYVVAERCTHVVLTSRSSVPCPVVPAWCHSCVPQTLVPLRCFTFGDPPTAWLPEPETHQDPQKINNRIQSIHELALNTSYDAQCVHKNLTYRVHKVILSGDQAWVLTVTTRVPMSDVTGRRMRRFPGWEVSALVPVAGEKLVRYSTKNSKDCREVALSTEKSQSVWNRRVEPVCMGEGGRFGRGVWCCRDKTKWHWSEPHIVSDKDAAKRAARALPVNREFNRGKRTRSGQQVFVFRPLCSAVRAATMLLPSGTLILLLAALYSSVDLTEAEVSAWNISNIMGDIKFTLAHKLPKFHVRF